MLAAIGRRFRPSPPLSSLINIFAWDWDVDVTRRRRRVVVVLAAAGWQCFEVGAGRGTEHDRTPGSKHEGHTGTSDSNCTSLAPFLVKSPTQQFS